MNLKTNWKCAKMTSDVVIRFFLNLLFIFVVVDWNQPSALQSLRTQTTGRRQMIKREALKKTTTSAFGFQNQSVSMTSLCNRNSN